MSDVRDRRRTLRNHNQPKPSQLAALSAYGTRGCIPIRNSAADAAPMGINHVDATSPGAIFSELMS